jgi:hypothetical protein
MRKEWRLIFKAQCRYCQKPLKNGGKAFREGETNTFACNGCHRLLEKGIEPIVSAAPSQECIARANALLNLGSMLSAEGQVELKDILKRLQTEFADDACARKFIAEFYHVRKHDSFICMCLKFDGHCTSCGSKVSSGTIGVWEKTAHRVWCLSCVGSLGAY